MRLITRRRNVRDVARYTRWYRIQTHVLLWQPRIYPNGCDDTGCTICNAWRDSRNDELVNEIKGRY